MPNDYAELEFWHQANAGKHSPLQETSHLTDSGRYAGLKARWSQEVNQVARMSNAEGDGYFDSSRIVQAFLLVLLMPDWKKEKSHPAG